jgi:hypothetical protein
VQGSQINLDQLATNLMPYLNEALKHAAEFSGDVFSELSKSASGGVATLTTASLRSLGGAVWNRVRSSRVHAKFEKDWASAGSVRAREEAVRFLLKSDPRLAGSLHGLLIRRDFVRAVMEHSEHLPRVGLLDPARRLSDIYVPLSLGRTNESAASQANIVVPDVADPVDPFGQLSSGNHLVVGDPGSGKSTFARMLVVEHAQRILLDPQAVTFDQIRLPILVNASSVCAARSDFTSSLEFAVKVDMGFEALGPLPSQFFVPYAEDGHGLWSVVIDGLDEIEDRLERQRFWDAISRLHSQFGNSLNFVVTTRPDSIQTRDGDGFQRWRLSRLDKANQTLLARRYIQGTDVAQKFLERVSHSEFREICSIPLFEALAASIFQESATLPSTKFELCKAFSFHLIEKLLGSAKEQYEPFTELLSEIALQRDLDAESSAARVLAPRHLPKLRAQEYLHGLLARSGFFVRVPASFGFVHDVFRSYFAAAAIAQRHKPTATVWLDLDPFTLGWTTIEYVCEAWAANDQDISSAVEALLGFGSRGETSATEVAVSCRNVSDVVVGDIVERLIREMFSMGPTTDGCLALTQLARSRELVRSRLYDLATGVRDFAGARLACAECLLQSGHEADGIDALELTATDRSAYCGDRVHAAELLLGRGHREPSVRVLEEIARDGDELWTRADAAALLYEAQKTSENLALLRELLREPEDKIERVLEHTLERIMALGEKDLALPILRNRATSTHSSFGLPRDQIDAASAIARQHDQDEGVSLLLALVDDTQFSLRGRLESLDALSEFLAGSELSAHLERFAKDPANRLQFDWFGLEMLIRHGLHDDASEIGTSLIEAAQSNDIAPHDIESVIDRIAPFANRAKLADLLRGTLDSSRRPRLATSLAKIGYRPEAVARLRSLLQSDDTDVQLEAAATLCVLGERREGVRTLSRFVRATNAPVDLRFRAAWELERVAEHKKADEAHSFLLRDDSLSIEARCKAAAHFNEDGVHQGQLVWSVLFPLLEDETNSLDDRIRVAAELFHTDDDDGWGDYDEFDVARELFAILSEAVPTKSQRAKIRKLLKSRGFSVPRKSPKKRTS